MDRLLLMKPPEGGLPGETGDYALAMNKPIYGTKDEGRGFGLNLKEVVLSQGYTLNRILPTMFTLRKNGKIASE